VRQVSEKLREGTHVLLAAPRRFGKTSIMYRLIDKLLWDYYVVQVDLEGLDHPAELVVRLLESVAKVNRLTNLVAGMGATAEKLASLVKSSAAEIEVFKFRVKLRDETAKHKHYEFVRTVIESLDNKEEFFVIGRAVEYLQTEEESLLEKLSPEVKEAVKLVVDSLRSPLQSQVQE
jgi:AAA+ ATPase superfamily predicted ATPase